MAFKVLVVDDDEVTRELLSAMLAMLDLEVVVAETGAAATRQLNLQAFDLALVDLRLPDMDGLDVVRAIRANSWSRGAPVLATSGLEATEEEQRCFEAGCQGFLAKPFTLQKLAEAVRQVLPLPHHS